ncbi:MAG TPA: alpha/beta hydrolase [Polyangiales bacterium]|nr:alpha/beta hydrolase [Polyangiales bacterium]
MSDAIEIEHHHAHVNGIRYHYAEAGAGPLVVMIHGFPDLWYAYRSQLTALAAAGYRAVAIDLRGFGTSEVTARVEDYSLLQHGEDVNALIASLGVQTVTLVGHDWGANLVWAMALRYPALVQRVVALSIPFYPEPRDPAEIKRYAQGRFNFMEYFQRPGAAEAEFQKNPRQFLLAFLYGLSGDAPAGTIERLYQGKPADASLLEGFPLPERLPGWLSEADLDYYVAAFEKTGLSGALGFYRNLERDYAPLKAVYRNTLSQPVLFIGGAEEAAVRFGSLDPMRRALPQLKKALVLPGCGHWVQQERAEIVNRELISFLKLV